MDISVIIPVYGTEKYIRECLISLFSQTKTENVEFILVNDCTKDRAMVIANEVIIEYPNLNIRVIDHQENKGISGTRQTGIESAKGEYSIQIDSDDWCEPNMLEDLFNKAVNERADIVVCDYIKDYTDSTEYIEQHIGVDNTSSTKKLITGELHGSNWNKLIRHSLYSKNNISYIKGIDFCEDLLVCVKLFSYCKRISYLNKAFLHYRQNDNSVSYNVDINVFIKHSKAIEEIYRFLNKEQGDIFSNIMVRWMIRFKYSLVTKYKGVEQRVISKIFPDITDYIMFSNEIPYYHRLALYSASKGNLGLANTIWKIVSLLKKTS